MKRGLRDPGVTRLMAMSPLTESQTTVLLLRSDGKNWESDRPQQGRLVVVVAF
jgi:hypothetical protein